MPRYLLLLATVLVFAVPAHAQDPDGDIDEESLLQKAKPMVRDLYLHPDAIDPELMLRAGLQALERQSPRILVLERGESELVVQVGDSTRSLDIGGVDLDTAFDHFESAVLWAHPLLGDEDITEDDLRTAALSGALRTIDRHSSVIAGDRLDDFNVRFKGTLVGIGARIGRRDGALRVVKPFPDAPAGRAGLQVWDVISHVDGVATEAMSVDDAVDRIRGPEGVPVVLRVERAGEDFPRAFVIVREQVLVPSVESALLSGDVGYVNIDHFSRKTSREFVDHLDALSKRATLQGLVVDLRGNQGGSMIHAARIVNNFVEEGTLVQTEGRSGGRVRGLTPKVPATAARKRYDGPVAVLVDRKTASGSEIVAGGIKFLERGLIVGSQTFGKGTVQKVYSLTSDVSMKLTVARYLLPGVKFINHVGVTPDVALGELWLDPDDPTVPDAFLEPPELFGLSAGEGGLDARLNPGAGRAPTAGGINATPALRLLFPRVLSSWLPREEVIADSSSPEASSGDGEGTLGGHDAADALTGPPEEPTGDAKVQSLLPGDVGDDQFNDLELRIAHELLLQAAPTDRRTELLAKAGPIVRRWQESQSRRLSEGLALRDIAWSPSRSPRWLDRAPALEDETESALAQPRPPLSVTLRLPEALVAGEQATATLTVRNDTDRSWKRLRARLESSSSALDNSSFVIGDLPPGGTSDNEMSLSIHSRVESRVDNWRLYLLDDDGPLGSPWEGTVTTQGLNPRQLQLRASTEVEPSASGGIVLHVDVHVQNASVDPTGEVRILFGNPPNETVERTERFRELPSLPPGEAATGRLSLKVRDPSALGIVPIRLRATDMASGRFTTLALELPTGAGLPLADWHTPARVRLPDLTSKGSAAGLHPVTGVVTSPSPLESVEVLVDGDKLFTRRFGAEEDVRQVNFDVDAPIDVGPNLVLVRTRTSDGIAWTERRWVLGER